MNLWDFIVLGQIPGTQIQVSFDVWLMFSGGLASGFAFYITGRLMQSSRLLAALQIRRILLDTAYAQSLSTRHHTQA